MIGNNSCGARSARYGMTIDHVLELDVVLSDGARTRFGPVDQAEVDRRAVGQGIEARCYSAMPQLILEHGDAIRTGFPPHWRRSGGYRLDRMVPERGPFDLSRLVVGSEGTLAIAVEADVRLVEKPAASSAVAGHFESVTAALQAVEDAIDCDAAAIELVDRTILDLARLSPLHSRLTSVLVGDPGAILWIEFYGSSPREATALATALEERWRRHGHAYATVRADTAAQQRSFQALRKAGLGLLTAAAYGGERSLAFVEDTAVDPRRLSQYTQRFSAILERYGLRAGFYGHASAGCLHIRPFMDLTRPGEIKRMRAVAEEVRSLVAEFGGMNSSEHGDGLVRSEFNRAVFGDALYDAMRAVKQIFDPHGRLNPGKKVDAVPMTENLRDPALPPGGPLVTNFLFDGAGGMRGAANRCMRIGACRKSDGAGGTMCPSFMATRAEEHTTRGRANALVMALSTPDPKASLGDHRLHEILDLCIECKACRTECPLSIDMARLKSEFLSHYHEVNGIPLRTRLFAKVRRLNRLGSALAPVSNWLMRPRLLRSLAERFTDIDRRRPLPRFHRRTLQTWFAGRRPAYDTPRRGQIIFLADSFTSYTEPHIGRAAIELLERAGYEVQLEGNACCARALISKGMLTEARTCQADLIDRLVPAARAGVAIVGCEPSCVFTLTDDLPALAPPDRAEDAATIARQSRLVDDVLLDAVRDGSLSLDALAPTAGRRILFHPHCHQKAARASAGSTELLEQIPGAEVVTLDAGCCGMAGSFGFEREHYDLSMRIGGMRLFPAVTAATADALLVATGASCRQQIEHGTGRIAQHPVMLLHAAIRAT
jgi:Fe-S oxidoreductase/FAD/FMN-containing dehydrogenase